MKQTTHAPLKKHIMATLFYEPSTRTSCSFQADMLRLGGSIECSKRRNLTRNDSHAIVIVMSLPYVIQIKVLHWKHQTYLRNLF